MLFIRQIDSFLPFLSYVQRDQLKNIHFSKENAVQFQTLHSTDTFISRPGPTRERRPTYEKEGLPFQFGAIYEAVGRFHKSDRGNTDRRRAHLTISRNAEERGLIHHHLKYPVLFPLVHRARNILARDNKVNTVYT